MVIIVLRITSIEQFRKIASYMDCHYKGKWNANSKIRKRIDRLRYSRLDFIEEQIKINTDINENELHSLKTMLSLLQ